MRWRIVNDEVILWQLVRKSCGLEASVYRLRSVLCGKNILGKNVKYPYHHQVAVNQCCTSCPPGLAMHINRPNILWLIQRCRKVFYPRTNRQKFIYEFHTAKQIYLTRRTENICGWKLQKLNTFCSPAFLIVCKKVELIVLVHRNDGFNIFRLNKLK